MSRAPLLARNLLDRLPDRHGLRRLARDKRAVAGVTAGALVLTMSVAATRGDDPELPLATAASAGADDAAAAEDAEPTLPDDLTLTRLEDPARTVVEDADGRWVATFTDGASTVALAGPERRFDEPTAHAGVTTDAWVRVLPAPFDGEIDPVWFEEARADDSPDVLEIATQYFAGAPEVRDDAGVRIAGEADYGPEQPDGSRPVGADWNDYQELEATYGDQADPPEPEEAVSLDCSGYTRMVYGVRAGMDMSLRPDGGASIPRRSFEQAAEAPGVTPITGRELVPEQLQAGDLVFMDSPGDSDDRIDHVGIYVGVDDDGHHRFLHSRPSANGPTIGGDDVHPSVIDGDGYYARGFVSTRRL